MANYKVGDKVTVRKRVDTWPSPLREEAVVYWADGADRIIGQRFTIMEVRVGYGVHDYRLNTYGPEKLDWNYLFPEESFGSKTGEQLVFKWFKD